MLKQLLLLLFIYSSTIAISQDHSIKNMKKIEDIKNIYQEVKHSKKEPHYGIYFSSSNANFEIRVNDIPVFIGYSYITNDISPKSSYVPINTSIFKTGIQTIEIKMYPSYNSNTQKLDSSLNNSQVEIDIVSRDFDSQKDEYSEEKAIYSWAAPCEMNEKTSTLEFIYPNKTEFSHMDTFMASVPYNINILKDAQNLIATDTNKLAELTKNLVKKYIDMSKIYSDNDISAYADLIYEKELMLAQQLFFTQSDSEKRADQDLLENGKIVKEGYHMNPLQDFEIRFYAAGKIVTLVYNNLAKRGRMKSALISSNDTNQKISYSTLFYKSEGSDEFILF